MKQLHNFEMVNENALQFLSDSSYYFKDNSVKSFSLIGFIRSKHSYLILISLVDFPEGRYMSWIIKIVCLSPAKHIILRGKMQASVYIIWSKCITTICKIWHKFPLKVESNEAPHISCLSTSDLILYWRTISCLKER